VLTAPRRRGQPASLLLAPALALVALLALLALPAPPARAHIIPGAVTLSQLTRSADVVAVARIANPSATIELKDRPVKRQVVDAEIIEVIRGEIQRGPVRFVPHGHAGEQYDKEEVVLLFLDRIEEAKDLASAQLAGAVRFAGIEEVADRIRLEESARAEILAAVRAYAAAEAQPDAETKREELRRITKGLLASGQMRLAASALRDLATAGSEPLIGEADVPELSRIIDDPSRPTSLRSGILAELERRKLVDAPPRWVRLLREAPAQDLPGVVRVAAKHRYPLVTAELIRILEGANREAAAAAAAAVGSRGDDTPVEALTRAIASDDPKLRFAAIDGLGRIGTPAAREALTRAATSHPDPATAREAQTALNLLGAQTTNTNTNTKAPASEPAKGPQAIAETGQAHTSIAQRYWKTLALLAVAALIATVALIRRSQSKPRAN
jgi:hypothetical protein